MQLQSKNIARLASFLLYSLVDCWLNPADSSIIRRIHSIHCKLHALFSLYALDKLIRVYNLLHSKEAFNSQLCMPSTYLNGSKYSCTPGKMYTSIELAPLCHNPGIGYVTVLL